MLDSVSSQTTKHRIMDAAEDIVMELGASRLTFDELVKHTGLSKGGILYHYPNKKALLRNMVERMIEIFENRRAALEAKGDLTGIVQAKSYLLASFDKNERFRTSSNSLMAVAANDPELLEIVRDHYKRNFSQIRSMGNKTMLAALIYLAVDGVWLLDALRLCPFTDEERVEFKNTLLNLADL